MAKQTEAEKLASNVEAAIFGLYDHYPSVSGCHRVKTPKTVEIERKIKVRKKELEDDAKLADLEGQLKAARLELIQRSKQGRRQVDELKRRFQLRGVSDKLISDIEALSKQKPVEFCDCCD